MDRPPPDPSKLLADWIRGHWSIENKVHWVRDVAYEYASDSFQGRNLYGRVSFSW